MYSIYLESEYYIISCDFFVLCFVFAEQFSEKLGGLGETAAILLNDRIWAVKIANMA